MKKFYRFLILLLAPVSLIGQQPPVTNQYILNPLSINPAFAGNRGALNIAAFYRKQWVGIPGAPETMTLAMDAPVLDGKLGLGLIVVNDRIGVTRATQFSSNYAYRISMGDGMLSFGLGAGLITTNTAWSDLVVLDPGDEIYLSDSRAFYVPDFSFGVYYSYRNYFAGLSIPKLLGYGFDYPENKYTLSVDPGQYYYLFNTGYLITLSQKTKFFPSVLFSYSPGDKLLYEVNAHFNLFDRLWVGASYRSERSVTGLLQFSINNQVKAAYSYDFDFGDLRTYTSGSHEIMLRYVFNYRVEVVNPLIF